MKKSFLCIALLTVLAAVVCSGCNKSEESTPPAPEIPATNAPAPAQ